MISQAAMDEIRAFVEADGWNAMNDSEKLRSIIDSLGHGIFPQPHRRMWLIQLAEKLERLEAADRASA